MGSRPRRGRARPAIRLLLVAQVLLAVLYAEAIPVFEGPDAEGHLDAIAQHQEDGFARAQLDAASAARSHELIQQPPLYYRLAAGLAGRVPAAALASRFRLNPYYPGLSQRVSLPSPPRTAQEDWPARAAIWLSMLAAVLATTATYSLARRVWPADGAAPLAAAAVVAFNPQFLQSAATVSNDALAAGTAALAVCLALRLASLAPGIGVKDIAAPGPRFKDQARLLALGTAFGTALGAALVSKYSGLLVTVPTGILLAGALRRRPRALLPPLAAALAAALLVAGPWYLANLRESGRLVPTATMLRLLPDLAREAPIAWRAAIRESMWLRHSYWGVFGHGFLADTAYYRAVGALGLLAAAGIAVAARRGLRRRPWRSAAGVLHAGPWLWIVAWLLVSYGALLLWIRTVQFANQGRLLFGAAPAAALLLVMGWRSLVPRRSRLVSRLSVAVMAGLAVSQLATLQAAFHPAPSLTVASPGRPVQAVFASGMRLLGLDLDTPTVTGSGALELRLYWTTARPIDGDAMTFVHLVDATGRKLAAVDQVPLAGRHPSRAWRPGEVFAERWRLPVAVVAEDTLATLVVGAYAGENPAERLAIRDGDGRPLGDELRLGPVLLRPEGAVDPPCDLAGPAGGDLRWRAGMRLEGVAPLAESPRVPLAFQLCWSADRAPRRDLSLFVQLLDADDHILAQWDGAPGDGRRPVATWRRSDRVRDEIRLRPAAGADLGAWERVIVGWYDPLTGRREPLRDGRDHMVLMERGGSGISPAAPSAP